MSGFASNVLFHQLDANAVAVELHFHFRRWTFLPMFGLNKLIGSFHVAVTNDS